MAINTRNTTKAHAPDLQAFAPEDIIPEALILSAATKVAEIEGDEPSVRVPFVDATGDPTYVAEGGTINATDPDTTESLIHTGKLAHRVILSREQFVQNGMEGMFARAMQRAMIRAADVAFMSQAAPTNPAVTPPAGILNQSPTGGGQVDADLDALVDAVTGIQAAYGTPNLILASPTSWSYLLKLKQSTDSNASLLDHRVDPAQMRVVGLPVIVNQAVGDDNLVVLDSSAVLSAVGNIQLSVSDQAEHASDSYSLRATMRAGQVITDVNRVVHLTTPSDAS